MAQWPSDPNDWMIEQLIDQVTESQSDQVSK